MTPDSAPAGRVVDDPFTASKRYTVDYADPPWHYRDRANAGERGAGLQHHAQGHVRTQSSPTKIPHIFPKTSSRCVRNAVAA